MAAGTEQPGPWLQAELGFEKADLGPTTNFVGNHMTQGAIDLVQAELEGPQEEEAPLLLGLGAVEQRGPLLLGTAPAPTPPIALPLAQYRWWNEGGCVCLEVPLPDTSGRGQPAALSLELRLTATSLDLTLSTRGVGGLPAPAPRRLSVSPLWGPIDPAHSTCSVAPGGGARAEGPATHAAGPLVGSSQVDGAVMLGLTLPSSAGASGVSVRLAKAAPEQEWAGLQGVAAHPAGALGVPKSQADGDIPTLAALRYGLLSALFLLHHQSLQC